MTSWQWARNLRPAGLVFYGVIGAALLLLIWFPLLFPHGLRTGGPEVHQGLFVVHDGNWSRSSFEPLSLLVENERLRSRGQQRVRNICLNADAIRPELERALGDARRDRFGARGVWLQVVATPYFGELRCSYAGRRGRGTPVGTTYRVTAIREARPLPCDPLTFILNRRRCPAPPARAVPLRLDAAGRYPAPALRRGTEGRVVVEALVGPQGKLLSCKPVASSGEEDLDRAACSVFAENVARFAGKGSTEGLAAGVRRIRVPIRFEIDKSAPASDTSSLR